MSRLRAWRRAATVGVFILLLPGFSRAADLDTGDGTGDDSVHRLRDRAEQLYLAGDDLGAEQLFLQLAAVPEVPAADRSEALVTAAWLQYLRQQEGEAVINLESALEISPTVRVDGALFDGGFTELFDRAQGRVEERREAAAKGLLKSGKQHLYDGDLEAARQTLEELLSMSPRADVRALAIYSLAVIEMRSDNPDAARQRFEEVLQFEPTPESAKLHAGARSNLGTILFRQGLLAAAEQAWIEATVLDPAALVAWRNIGLARSEQGNEIGAVDALRVAHRLGPTDPESIRLLARSLRRTGSVQEAAALLEAGLEHHQKNASLWLARGSALRAAGSSLEATAAYEQAVALDPLNATGKAVRAAVFLCLMATEQGRYDEAERWARSALAWNDKTPEHWDYLALALRAQGRLDDSLNAFEHSMALDPSRAGVSANLGSVLTELGRYSEAEEEFEGALRLDPTNLTATEGLTRIQAHREAADSKAEPGRRAKRLTDVSDADTRPISPRKLGVRFVELDYDRLGLRGALVREVVKRSPAARTGLRRGDLILRIDGFQILDDKDFFAHLKRNPPVDGLEIEILRDAALDTLALKIR